MQSCIQSQQAVHTATVVPYTLSDAFEFGKTDGVFIRLAALIRRWASEPCDYTVRHRCAKWSLKFSLFFNYSEDCT